MAACDDCYCRSFYLIAAKLIPEIGIGTRPTDIDYERALCAVPTLEWHPVGDDAILVGYNEAMIEFAPHVPLLLGKASSDISGEVCHCDIMACAATTQSTINETIRRLHGNGEVWRLLRYVRWREDGAVLISVLPLQRLDVVRSVREKSENKVS